MKTSIRSFLSATPSNGLAPNAGFLRANSDAYEWLLGQLQKMDLRKGAEAVLGRLAFAAQFAAEFHSGSFANGATEPTHNVTSGMGRGASEPSRVRSEACSATRRRRGALPGTPFVKSLRKDYKGL